MSTSISGDNPSAVKAPPATNGQVTTRKKRKQRAKRAAAVPKAPAVQASAPTTRAAPRKAARTAPTRTAPIGIASGGNATDLMTGFIQSMPKAGTVLAAQSRDACKATFAALIDWLYPATKAA